METSGRGKTFLVLFAATLFVFIVFGLMWFFFIGPDSPVGLGWYAFSFAAGLSMIVLPCTLPLAFVIVPLSMGKGPLKGLAIATAFGVGVALTLSTYGILAALIGSVAIGTLGAPLEVVKNWLYFIAGTFAYLFALGELGLINFRMPTYSGAAPAFIQKQRDIIKALLLGLFLGNIGVGCPHPATPVILTRIAISGDVFYGWLLFFVHAVGRVLPLLLLAILGILGINALSWLVARKDKIERATGWGMVVVAAFILVLGLFSHDWWVFSGQHTLLEEVTQEEHFLGLIIARFHLAGVPHVHGIPTGTGLFGLPLAFGNMALVFLWVLPLWWAVWKKSHEQKLPDDEKRIEDRVAPLRWGMLGVLTLLLVVLFVIVLPERFYTRATLHELTERNDHVDAIHPTPAEHMEETHGQPIPTMHGEENDIYHEEKDITSGLSVNMTVTPAMPNAGSLARFQFFVNEKPTGTPVTDLEINHEKLMHVIGIRDDMNEFFHIHPDASKSAGIYTVSHTFAKPGTYKVWSEVEHDGVDHIIGHAPLSVDGQGSVNEKNVSYARTFSVGDYKVEIEYGDLVKNRDSDLTIHVHDASGSEVAFDPYLGTSMHFTIIKDDLSVFLHTHPEDNHMQSDSSGVTTKVFAHEEEGSSAPSQEHGVTFHATFPQAGVYKVFAQFRPKGATLAQDDTVLAQFWVKVEENASSGIPAKFWLVLISLVSIVLLSLATKKFITVAKVSGKTKET